MTDPTLCGDVVELSIDGQDYTGVCTEYTGHYPNTRHSDGIFSWTKE